MLMKMFRYMSSNCSYSNLVFPSYVKEELFYDLCKFGFNTVVSSHSAHSFFQLSQTVGYELIHILFNLKYFNPLGILRTHCGLFELHKFCCLALFIYLFSGNHTHMHKYTGALLSPELAKEGNGAPLKMYRAHKSQSSNHKP